MKRKASLFDEMGPVILTLIVVSAYKMLRRLLVVLAVRWLISTLLQQPSDPQLRMWSII